MSTHPSLRTLLLAVLMLAPLTGLRAQSNPDETIVPAKLEAVTVYIQGAEMRLTARIPQIQVGQHRLVIQGLSPSLDDRSIVVTGEGAGVIQSVTYRVNYLNRTATPVRLNGINDSLEILNFADGVLNDEKFVLEKEQELILHNNSITSEQQGVTAAQLEQLATFYRTRLQGIRTRLSEIALAKKKINETRTRLNQERAQLNENRDVPTHEVVIAYEARTNGPLNLALKYRVSQAAWRPEYDLRLDGAQSEGALSLRAQVFNNTGIDWQQVKLALSNTVPSQDNSAPTLNPWYVGVYTPPVAMYRRQESVSRTSAAGGAYPAPQAARAEDSDDAYGGEGDSPAAEQEVLEEASTAADYTTTNQALLATEYNIALRYNIPADNKPHQVDVQNYRLPVGFEHFAAPKLSPYVFLRAQLTAWGQYNLMAGKVQVFFEGSYIGESQINPASTDDTLRISLGRDNNVTIRREPITEFTSRRAIGTNIKEERAYKITIRNQRRNAIRIRIEDQIPVSSDSRIEVTPTQTEGWDHTATTGKLTRIFEIQPEGNATAEFRFEVKYPKGLTLTGF